MENDQVHDVVQTGYAEIARQGGGCCGSAAAKTHAEAASRIGYTEEDATGAAAEANLGLGCGNPTALASLKAGEVVVDLGSGAGFDALLSAEKLGPEGRFIGVDMTPEMLERARTNAVNAGYARTVEFREGLIENLPVASDTVDVVMSNCVVNLSPDKPQVFREAYRVLKPGGAARRQRHHIEPAIAARCGRARRELDRVRGWRVNRRRVLRSHSLRRF